MDGQNFRNCCIGQAFLKSWLRPWADASPLDAWQLVLKYFTGWPGCFINVKHCGGLSMVLLKLKAPSVLFEKGRELLPSSGFPYCRDMTKSFL